MAPTTLLGQVTATTVSGRRAAEHGYPLKIAEMLKILPGVVYIERVSLHGPQEIKNAKKAIRQAFDNQLGKAGFSLVEILSPCPTYLGLTSLQSREWIRDVMVKEFPLGRIK